MNCFWPLSMTSQSKTNGTRLLEPSNQRERHRKHIFGSWVEFHSLWNVNDFPYSYKWCFRKKPHFENPITFLIFLHKKNNTYHCVQEGPEVYVRNVTSGIWPPLLALQAIALSAKFWMTHSQISTSRSPRIPCNDLQILLPRLEEMEIGNFWFQQDDTTCHTSKDTITLLREKFPDNLLSVHQSWPPRSCDLTLCDFFLWDYLKSQVYENKPRDLDQLKAEIR